MNVRVYRPVPMDGFEWALPADEADYEMFRSLAGQSRATSWPSPQMRLLRVDDDGQPLHPAAMPWFGSHVLILRDAAIDAVGQLLAEYGEILPLTSSDADMAVFSARSLSGALDLERSDVVRFGTGRIMDLRRAEFRTEMIAGDLVDSIRSTGQSAGTDFVLA